MRGFIIGEMSSEEESYIDDLYADAIENDITYSIEPFDINNEEHLEVLKEQECEFWQA